MKGYRMDQGSRPTHKKEIVRYHPELFAGADQRSQGVVTGALNETSEDYRGWGNTR